MSETMEMSLDRVLDTVLDYQNHVDNGWIIDYMDDDAEHNADGDESFYTDMLDRFNAATGYLIEHRSELAALRSENAALLAALTGVLYGEPWVYEHDPDDGDYPDYCRYCHTRWELPERHAPTCEWRIAVELRDRIAARGKEAERE